MGHKLSSELGCTESPRNDRRRKRRKRWKRWKRSPRTRERTKSQSAKWVVSLNDLRMSLRFILYIYTYIYIYIHILYIYLDLRSSKVPTKMKYCPKIMEVLKGYRCSCCAHPHRTFASRKTLCHEDQQRLAATDPSCLCAGCRDIMPLWRQRYGCHQKRGVPGFTGIF